MHKDMQKDRSTCPFTPSTMRNTFFQNMAKRLFLFAAEDELLGSGIAISNITGFLILLALKEVLNYGELKVFLWKEHLYP
jgi:hypothetical protein